MYRRRVPSARFSSTARPATITFVPDNDAINALTEPTAANFTVTVSDGTLSANQTFTIAINGTNDAAVISGDIAGSTIEAGGVAD